MPFWQQMFLLVVLAAILVSSRILGALARRLGQPAILGELVAGILLGRSLFGILDPGEPFFSWMADIGVVILLFAIGLETDLRKLMRVGGSAVVVACTGVILPFFLGFITARGLGLSNVTAVVCGAALTATSVGISARVLSDLGRLNTDEGQIVLGAAVIDDIIGLVILSILASLIGGTAITVGSLAGSAAIIGAFAAGLILHEAGQRKRIEKSVTAIGHLFVPVFFAVVGAAVDLSVLRDAGILKIAAALFLVGVFGKFAAGYAPFWFRGSKSLIGIAMIPRGEVGLIFAQMGLASGALDSRLFSAVTLVVMGTTFLVPPLLGAYNKSPLRTVEENPRGSGGVDDLVA